MFVRTFILKNSFRRLDADNERSFVSLFVVFLFLGFSAIISDRDYRAEFRSSITFRSFIGIRRFKRLELRLEALFLFNQLEQDFATVKFDFSPD